MKTYGITTNIYEKIKKLQRKYIKIERIMKITKEFKGNIEMIESI